MAHYASSLFRPAVQNQPVTVLLLIENSQRMLSMWQELRDSCLVRMLDTIVSVNAAVPTSVSVIESIAIDNGANSSAPRQYNGPHEGLFNINFNPVPENRISATRVKECIDYLDTSMYEIGQPSSSLHLVIIAASTPTDDCSGTAITTSNNYSPWNPLAEKLTERNIHCHLVMSTQVDMTPLTLLFEDTLHMQNNIEETPPFPVDRSRTLFRLSARPMYNPLHESGKSCVLDTKLTLIDLFLASSGSASTEPSFAPQQRLTAPPRRNSYPLDNFYPEAFDDSASPGDGEAPSLVSHLQQVHGLTKKKVYGKPPARQPFIRDERVREPTSGAASTTSLPSTLNPDNSSPPSGSTPLASRFRKPTPLTTGQTIAPPGETISSPTQGGRAMSLSKLDRIQRVNQAGGGSSPTDVLGHGRRALAGAHGGLIGAGHGGVAAAAGWHAQRRGSRLSTPEPDGASIGSPGSSSGSMSGSGTLVPAVLGSNSGSATGLNLGLPLGSLSSSSLVGSVYDMSPGSGSSYVSSDLSSPVTPGSMEDLFGHTNARMTMGQHPSTHSLVYPSPPIGVQEAVAWNSQQQHQLQQQAQLQHQQQRQLQQIQEVHAMQHQQQVQAQAHQIQQIQEAQHQQQQQLVQAQVQAQYLNHGGYNPSAQTYFPPVHPSQNFYGDTTAVGDGMQGQQQSGMPESMVQAHAAQMQAQAQHEQQVQLQQLQQAKIQQQQQFAYANSMPMPISTTPPPIVPSQAPRAIGSVSSAPTAAVAETPANLISVTSTGVSPPPVQPGDVPSNANRSRANSVLIPSTATTTSVSTHIAVSNTTTAASTKASHRGSHSKHKKTSSTSHSHSGLTTTAPTAASNDDEERFTFGKEFVDATAALFEAEVLPAYPDFPGMSSGLVSDVVGAMGPSAGAGELYATRQRVRGVGLGAVVGGAPMGNAVMATTRNIPGHVVGMAAGGSSTAVANAHPPHSYANGQHAPTNESMHTTAAATGIASSTYASPAAAMFSNRTSYSYGAPSHPPVSGSLTGWAG